jgi:hypothetical protein
MFSGRRLPFSRPSPVLATGDVARFPDEPKVLSPNDDRSRRCGKVLLSRPQIVRHLLFAVLVSLGLTFVPTRSLAQG